LGRLLISCTARTRPTRRGRGLPFSVSIRVEFAKRLGLALRVAAEKSGGGSLELRFRAAAALVGAFRSGDGGGTFRAGGRALRTEVTVSEWWLRVSVCEFPTGTVAMQALGGVGACVRCETDGRCLVCLSACWGLASSGLWRVSPLFPLMQAVCSVAFGCRPSDCRVRGKQAKELGPGGRRGV